MHAQIKQEVAGVPLLPGGFGRSNYVVNGKVPVAIKGDGCWLQTDDDCRVIDLNNNFTALIHGHAEQRITEAAIAALEAGASFGLPNHWETKHAAALLNRVSWAEQVRHTNSGTEAVMTAIRVARAATGAAKVVIQSPAYHGTASTVLPALSTAANRGVPRAVAEQLIQIPGGDVDALEAAFTDHSAEIAAVLVDLMPTRGGLNAVSQEFVETCRNLCDSTDTYMILDEIISFRLGGGGFGATYGVVPDLLVVGKMVGGGLPIGAIIGTETSMRVLNPLQEGAIPHGGTFSGNPVSLSAGTAALELASFEELDRINRLGDQLRSRLTPIANQLGWAVNGRGSLLNFWPSADRKNDQLRLWRAAYERGVLITPGTCLMCISTPMDEDIAEDLGDRLIDSLEAVATQG